MINLPGYEFLEQIGEGGMATVWTARQVSLDRTVAIKILSSELVMNAEARALFRDEALKAAKLKHPGIVQVHDAGEHEGMVYLVMEYVAGCTIADLLERKGRLSEKNALLIAEGVAMALGYAWQEARIIHCDVKPANVLIDDDGSVKLADLGVAKYFRARAAGGEDVAFEGTPNYCAPEQARGEADLDQRADIYSLGAMLYHLTTGKMPFGDRDAGAAMEGQVSGYLPDPQELNAQLSFGVAWLIEKMMVKDRTLRHASWSGVIEDIEAVRGGGLPRGQLPSAGQSTVLRGELRSLAQPKVRVFEEEPVGRPEVKIRAAAKQKIVMPKGLRGKAFAPRQPTAQARAALSLVLMVLAVLAVYGSLALLRLVQPGLRRVDDGYWDRTQQLPPRSRVQGNAPPEAKPRLVKVNGYTTVAPASKPAEKTGSRAASWQHPSFLRGARAFNDALAKYREYTKTRQNPAVLAEIERKCREAIAAFESVRSFAPPDIKLPELIEQCYRLISDCRQSTLIASAPSPAPERASSPPPAAAGSAVTAPAEMDELVLAASWNTSVRQTGAEKVEQDLVEILRGKGQPGVDLQADTSIVLYRQFFYLMPVREALRLIGEASAPRRSVNCPGFPKDSLYYYPVSGRFEDGFNQMILITDGTDRLAAVQMVNEHPDQSLWLDPQFFSDRWNTYNFIQLRSKANAKWKVGLRAELQGRVLRIDSELVAVDEKGYFGLGDSKERAQLYLPQPLVNLILYRLQNGGKGS